jgi:hypothetical protein
VSWYDSGKKRFEDVGQDPDVAIATLSRREKSLEAKASGLTVLDDSEALEQQMNSPSRRLSASALRVIAQDSRQLFVELLFL